MGKRKHELLTDAEREQLIGIPRDRDGLARLYTFEPADIDVIGPRRAKRNLLGAALQLALIRHPGMSLAQLLQDTGEIPRELIAFVADQFGLSPVELADYASREQTMTDHARDLATRLGLRGPVRTDIPLMIDAACRAAWPTDKGIVIAAGVITGLRDVGILLPSISTIERASIAGRARARKQAAQALVTSLTAEQLSVLDGLFENTPGESVSRLTWLKAIPVTAKPDHIGQILDRLKFVRQIGIAADTASAIHVDRYRQFVREGRVSATYMIERYATAVENGEDPIDALDATVGWYNLLKIRHEVATIAETAHVDPLIVAGDKYATLRKFAPDLIEAMQFRAGKGSAKTIAAIETLRELNRAGKRDLPPNPPMPFRKEWQKLIVGEDGKANRRLWEVATLAHVRNKLRSGDVWVDRSAGYRRFDSYLLNEPQSAPIVASLGLPATADEWLTERSRQLDWRLKKFAQRLKRNDLEGVRFVDGRLQISPVRTVVPDVAEALEDRLDAMMPRIRITELLHEVARDTGFLKAFTNLRTGEPSPNESALLATILADGTNLGLSRMAAASEGVTRDQLMWTHDAYIREDTYRAALASIINTHNRLPFSKVWGSGTTSSSDGQFFRGAKRGASGGDINARYGVDFGFSFYTHNSDQRAPYHVNVISAATHEAPYVLDGLVAHGTNLNISEHYTDTGGATDHVFALCALLGYRFCPRLRDFPDRRLIPIGPPSSYPYIAPLLGKRSRTEIIGEQWGDVLRLVGSIKAGHVAPSVMLRKLAAYERQNQLDVALQEIGKIERTLFMLDWLENSELRRRCHAGLNNSEQRHVLTQAIYTFRQGRIIDRSHEAQQYRASGLNLVIAAIVYWNTTYMAEAVERLRSAGEIVPADLLAHTSPIGWEHIAFSGDFLWERAAASTGRKALNLPGQILAA